MPFTVIDISDVTRHGRQLEATGAGGLFARSVVAVKRELEAGADTIVDEAKIILSNKQTKTAGGTGLAAQGIARSRRVKVTGGGALVILIGWLRKYGPILEHGPVRLKEWIIRAKHATALRYFQGGSGGGAGAVRYAKSVRHVWDSSQMRPHLNPATDKMMPRIERRVLAAAGSALAGGR